MLKVQIHLLVPILLLEVVLVVAMVEELQVPRLVQVKILPASYFEQYEYLQKKNEIKS
jgi:hypothetical protein